MPTEGKVEHKMPKRHFWSVIRVVKNGSITNAVQLRAVTWETLKRLGAKRDLTKAVKGVPKGSDQVNIGAIVEWLRRVPATDADAVKQVVQLDATCTVRVTG